MNQAGAPHYCFKELNKSSDVIVKSGSSKITVIQVLPSLEFGGVEKGAVEIAKSLVNNGHRSIVISAGGDMLPQLLDTGSEHVLLPVGHKSLSSLYLIPKLRNIFKDSGASIVHARSRFPAWLCFLALKNLKSGKCPHFVTTVHGTYSVNRYSSIMTKGDKVIAISEFVRKYIKENYPQTDLTRISVIPRGIDPNYFSYGYIAEENWKRRWFNEFPETINKKLILLPARITRRKGHQKFLDVFSLLPFHAGLHGVIVGGPHKGKQKYLDFLKNKVNSMGLSHHITFTGHRSDIREIMSLSDIVVSLSSEPEAFGRTSLEALSLGIPVIAYDHGGASEVLKSIFPQGLVPANNVDETVSLIKKFIAQPPNVKHQQIYTLESMQNKTLSLYESLVQ